MDPVWSVLRGRKDLHPVQNPDRFRNTGTVHIMNADGNRGIGKRKAEIIFEKYTLKMYSA
jgi:hypothetical protein